MNGHRMTSPAMRTRPLPRRAADGVILLVMLGLLSIFTLVAVTFVVSSGHARRGARAASTAEQTGDPFDVLLNQAMMQVVRGSNHPQSAIGPWGILEDMYGDSDVVTGAVFHSNDTLGQSIYDEVSAESRRSNNNAFSDSFTDPVMGRSERYSAPMLIEIGAVSFGWDRQPGVALFDDTPSNGLIDDVDEWLQGDDCYLGMTKAHPATLGKEPSTWQGEWNNGTLPIIDNVDNYYAGRVITFVNGDCAGQSSYIVRSKVVSPSNDATLFRTVLFIQPFDNGSQPRKKDRFVINGRPFNGNGAGYSPYVRGSVPPTRKPSNSRLQRALDMPYNNTLLATPGYGFDKLEANGEPVAILPNPTDSGYRDYLTRFGPIVAMDEDYDIPDEQNMHMSYTIPTNGVYKTIIPSFHRPDLVRYHTGEHSTGGARWLDVPPYIRRRYILRPDPSDHYDYTQEPNALTPMQGDGWTPGEPFEDWNRNGYWDPVAKNPNTGAIGPEPYTDLPPNNKEYDQGDRSYFNTGIDMMDGPWDVDNNGDGQMDSIWLDLGMPTTTTPDGRFIKPLFAILVQDLDGRINVNAHGSPKHYTHVHNPTYPSELAYDPRTKPLDTRFGTEERVRMGIYNYAVMQLVRSADGATQLYNTTTGEGADVHRTHSVGDIDPNFHQMSPQDVRFAYNKLFALSYRGDGPGTNTLVANAAWMFDLNGFRSLLDGNADYDRALGGFEPAVGQGWSVADVNIAQVLHNGLAGLPAMTPPSYNPPVLFLRSNPIRRIIEGQGDPGGGMVPPVMGRYGEMQLLRTPGCRFPISHVPYELYGYYPGLGTVPRAGITDLLVPRPDYYASTQPSALATAEFAMVPDMGGADTAVPSATFYASAPYMGDDDNPRLPSFPDNSQWLTTNYGIQNGYGEQRYAFGSRFRNSFPTKLPTPEDWKANATLAKAIFDKHNYYVPISDYGTPADFDSDGFVALDIMGNPVYEKMGTEYEDIDAPTEINLNRRYFAQTFFGATSTAANRAKTADIDAPFSPPEMERVLRRYDGNSGSLPNRLWNTLYNDPNTLVRANVSGDAERSITTEQWDVPCPHIAPTPELTTALATLGLPLVSPSLGDLLRARFYLSYGMQATPTQTAQLATIAMRSYRLGVSETATNGQLPSSARKRMQTRLLSPDLGMGVKMDINAPFGNGFDDDFNSVVDNPQEILFNPQNNSFEPLASKPLATPFFFDGNRDGNIVPNHDEESRQQYAKELYCLMMLLVDQRYVEPKATAVNRTSTAPGAETIAFPKMLASDDESRTFAYLGSDREMKTRRWLFARKIAQWAVNTVDFRDRDSIMTPFEFDAEPFFDNDEDIGKVGTPWTINTTKPTTNGTWDVDGYIIRNEAVSDPNTDPDLKKPWRGLVWGCEFPDLILTESVAFHDRRTQNLKADYDNGDPNRPILPTTPTPNTFTNLSPLMGTPQPSGGFVDQDWDQWRIPQGTALFELYATGNRHNPALPRELYSLPGPPYYIPDPVIAAISPPPPYAPKLVTEYRLDLGRLAGNPNGPPATGGGSTTYPIWRLAITESHTTSGDANDMRMSIAERIQEWPQTCSLELNDPGMSLLNPQVFDNVQTAKVPIERVVHFSTSTTASVGAKSGLVNSSGNNTNIEVFFNRGGAANAFVAPGDYVVVGPHRLPSTSGGLKNITTIGRTEKKMLNVPPTGAVTQIDNYNQPQAIIDMGDDATGRPFLVSSVNGVDEYPRTGFPSSFVALGGLLKMPSSVDLGLVDAANTMLPPGLTSPDPMRPYPPNIPPQNVRQIRPPVAIPVAAFLAPNRWIGLNVSERSSISSLTYYPNPTGAPRADVWNPAFTTTDRYNPARDIPLDDDLDGSLPRATPNPMLPHLTTGPTPGATQDQSLLNFKTVFLQRLANPLSAWNAYTNPYLTIDWMPIDLTIFNGEPYYFEAAATPSTVAFPLTDRGFTEEPNQLSDAAKQHRFGSRQRGAPRYPVRGLYSMFDLWSQPNWIDKSPEFDTRPPLTGRVSDSTLTIATGLTPPSTIRYSDYYAVNPVRWQHPLDHTLGYLNQGYHVMREWPGATADPKMHQVSPVREPIRRPMYNNNSPYPRAGFYTQTDVTRDNDKYIGAPKRPFNWLNWNNRPFAGSMELMLVPCTTQARLLHDYSMRRTVTPSAPEVGSSHYNNRLAPFDPRRSANSYFPSLPAAGHTNWVGGTGVNGSRLAYGYTVTAPFAHLLNFFESTNQALERQPSDPIDGSVDNLPGTLPDNPTFIPGAANYFRLFEFVTVPSRFSGTKRMNVNPMRNNASAPDGTAAYGTLDEHMGWPFTAPFNYVPLYREPGRININTIIPLGEHGFQLYQIGHNYLYTRRHRSERYNDDGAAIWRSVVNDFHPAIRWLPTIENPPLGATDNGRKMRSDMSFGTRAQAMISAPNGSTHKYFFNPSEDTVDNFFSLYASLFNDNPDYDPRGTDGVYGTGADPIHRPFSDINGPSRQERSRTSLFSNPFRSFISDYSNVVPESNKNRSSSSQLPLLAADSTLMRRRDTTWSPWSPTWRPQLADAADASSGYDAGSPKLVSPAHIDPRFDPMFALNYPRPFQMPRGDPMRGIPPTIHNPTNAAFPSVALGPTWWQYSGYTSPLFDARAGTTLPYPTPPGGSPFVSIDAMRIRDTDFRNTDRSPFFRYQMYTKLGNAVTTRSNVYAIWITIGFFECERVQPGVQFPVQTGHKAAEEFATKHRYPDGFRILREIGGESGETQRHRAFAIIDRTIPVGFMRGENLNVDRAFLVNHIVE